MGEGGRATVYSARHFEAGRIRWDFKLTHTPVPPEPYSPPHLGANRVVSRPWRTCSTIKQVELDPKALVELSDRIYMNISSTEWATTKKSGTSNPKPFPSTHSYPVLPPFCRIHVSDVCCDSFVRHDVVAPEEGVGAGVDSLLAFLLLMLRQVPCRQLLSAGRAAGRAARALGPLVAFHPVAPVTVSAALVAAFYPTHSSGNQATECVQSTREVQTYALTRERMCVLRETCGGKARSCL